MENQIHKCSSKNHSNNEANIYCLQCKLYLCKKCQNNHSELFVEHSLIKMNQDKNNIFIEQCTKENHELNKLKFFCKTHNELCCSYCISKIKNNFFGQHSDCDIYFINDIKNEKEDKLKENLIILEQLSKNIKVLLNDLNKIAENVNENKEKIKLKIQKIFTKLRNAINEKEDKLILEIDNKYNDRYIKEDIIRKSKKLPSKIKQSFEKGKKDIENMGNIRHLSSFINDCINIENNIKEINEINSLVNNNKLKNNDIEIECELENDKIDNILEEINSICFINDLYKDFNIGEKKEKYVLNYHTNNVNCLTIMKDGRLVSGSFDSNIIIYNKKTFEPDLIIKEHKGYVLCIIQMSSGLLASSSCDHTIKLFNIKDNYYEVIQSLNFHQKGILKIIELENKALVSCSHDKSIIFYTKNEKGFNKDFQISTNGNCTTIIQTNLKEICYPEREKNRICFYDFIERKIIASIDNISKYEEYRENFIKINEELLAIPGENKISIINLNNYKLVKIIDVAFSGWIYGICLINNNILLTGDDSKNLIQWKIENDNLILISKKENAHDKEILFLLNMGNGHFASGSLDKKIKIW